MLQQLNLAFSLTMNAELESVLIGVWRQALVENERVIEIDGGSYPVVRTPRRRLRQVDFKFQGEAFRGLEQNPATTSRWAEAARRGSRVMQFLSGSRYIAVVVDGKVFPYGLR